MTDYEVKTTATISTERLEDLMVGALEGGSTYWCEGFTPASYPKGKSWGHEAVAAGIPFEIITEEGTWDIVNSEKKIKDTLQLMADEHPFHFNNFVNETDDAETSDVFFQLLCFGEVVYG